jgi:hypothetical protein
MKTKIILSIGAGFILALTGNAQINIPGVFSTGVDDSGNLLSAGAADPYWTISSSPDGAVPAFVTASRNKSWVANTSSSQWINATGLGDEIEPTGLYIYTLTFSLNGFDPSTAQITGEWASDNQSEIFLNGSNTSFANGGTNGFKSLAPFSITSDFVTGENELQFYVTQIPPTGKMDPEGLQVDIFSATADPVPEPVTLSLFALSMLGIYVIKKRTARSQHLRGIRK